MTTGGDDVMRFLVGACERATSVGVVSPGMFPILVIGLRDCVGGSLGRSDWQDRLSWWEWLMGHPMSVRSAAVFYAPVCCLAVCCAAELSSNVLFGGTVCIWLAGRGLFFRQVGISSVMAADSAAAVGGRAGITFDVELVIPWDAPEAVVDLHSDILMEAAVCRILQERDVRSVRVLVPDYRGLERNFHDVTIVDMGDLPEVSVSLDHLSMLRRWAGTRRDATSPAASSPVSTHHARSAE